MIFISFSMVASILSDWVKLKKILFSETAGVIVLIGRNVYMVLKKVYVFVVVWKLKMATTT